MDEGAGRGEDGFVMVRAPDVGHAGRVGDRVSVTDRNEASVYVLFASGIRECYPPLQFAALFSRCSVRQD